MQTGDRIRLDVPKRSIELLVDDAELTDAAPRCSWRRPPHEGSDRGYSWLFQQHVTQADEGCDFDFLQSAGCGAENPIACTYICTAMLRALRFAPV